MKRRNGAACAVLIAVGLYLLIPVLCTFVYAFCTAWTDLLPRSFTLKFFLEIFEDPRFLPSIGRALIISVIPILITTCAVTLALYVCTVYAPKLERLVQTLCMAPYTIQGVILAVAVLTMYSAQTGFLGNRIIMLSGVYCICIMPHIYTGVRNSLNTVNVPRMLEAAEILGAGKLYAFVRTILPSLLSGVVISAMMSLAGLIGDYVVIKILAGSYWTTAMVLLMNSRSVEGQLSSAMIVVIFSINLLISFAVFTLRRHSQEKRSRVHSAK